MNVARVITSALAEISQSNINILMQTYNCTRAEVEDACSKALNLIAEHGSKSKAMSMMEKDLSEFSSSENWEDYEKLTMIKIIIGMIIA